MKGRRNMGKQTLTVVRLTTEERKRVAEVAKRSEMSADEWLRLAIMSACSVDEAHWREMADRETIRNEIVDHTRFDVLTHHLRGVAPSALEGLIRAMVAEREHGRIEGSQSALRLAAVRER